MTEYNSDEALKLENQMCFPLYAAARKVVSAYTPLLKPLGITYTQYILFLVLWEKDEITVSDICDKLMLDSGTVTPLLKKLESKNYLDRVRCDYDERRVLIKLTDEGRALKEQARDIPSKMANCSLLPPEKAALMIELLSEILAH